MFSRNRLSRGGFFLIPALAVSGCTGPEPREMGVIGYHLTFSVAAYTWIIVSLVTLVSKKLGRPSMVIPQRQIDGQLATAALVAVALSVILSAAVPHASYPIFSVIPLVEWSLLQLFSFLVLPFMAILVLLAYLITLLPPLRKHRPWTPTIAVVLHWLFCAHLFLVR